MVDGQSTGRLTGGEVQLATLGRLTERDGVACRTAVLLPGQTVHREERCLHVGAAGTTPPVPVGSGPA